MNVVSVGDVLTASRTGKSQFYSHFSSRDELVRTVLEFNESRICRMMSESIESWDDLERFLRYHLEQQRATGFARGCPFGTAAYSLEKEQEEERTPLQGILNAMRKRLQRFFQHEKQAGNMVAEASPKRLADFTIASVQGGMLLSLIEKNGNALRNSISESLVHLKSYRQK